ncbi:TetR-like C-terminal domain-containing protein [Nocardia inohanensis]|uniref:TetR-like C-terminal domain-containing protein n=1 Tax=Nocardia inohanensis TaxID=209246 RepID=UPI001FDF8FC4|nr:TetR-like C-terminal domain-containing protein [Nocardia inohanensis]
MGRARTHSAHFLHEIQHALTEQPSIAVALIAVSFRSEAAARALRRLWESRYSQSEIIVRRAIERGELSAHTDARALLVAATAPLYQELVLLRTPPDPGLPGRAALAAASAARAGAFVNRPSSAGEVDAQGGAGRAGVQADQFGELVDE